MRTGLELAVVLESRVFTLWTESQQARNASTIQTSRRVSPNPWRAGSIVSPRDFHKLTARSTLLSRRIPRVLRDSLIDAECCSLSGRMFFSPFRVHFFIFCPVAFLLHSSLSLSFFFLFFSLHLSRMPRRIHFYRCAPSFAFSRVDSPASLSRPAIFL